MRCPSFSWSRKRIFRSLLFPVLLVALCTGGALVAALSAPVTVNPNLIVIPVTTLTTTQPPAVTCTAPCECMLQSSAVAKWGENGYTRCSESPCGQQQAVTAGIAAVPANKYCYKAKPVRVVTARLLVTPAIRLQETVPIMQKRACGAGLTLCNGLICVNTSINKNNCGSCGNICPAQESCTNGKCTVKIAQRRTCTTGLSLCGPLMCVDTGSDSDNCGSCGHSCPATRVCVNGQCQVPVKALVTPDPCVYQSKTNCGGTCKDTASDPDNCGKCGKHCVQGTTCCSGTCTDTKTDPKNCGHCGYACNEGAGDYCDGQCEHGCAAGLVDCNPYECDDLMTDNQNCGGCGNQCIQGLTCMHGQCQQDSDGDGIMDPQDNCPNTVNPDQEDADGDHIGDACDMCPHMSDELCADSKPDEFPDILTWCWDYTGSDIAEDADNDGVGDRCDICPKAYNPDQKDSDNDGIGDACDSCPYLSNPLQADLDSDGDGFADICDTCPGIFNPDQAPPSGTSGVHSAASILKSCYGCDIMLNPAVDDINNNGIKDSCEPYVSLLFVPLNWQGSQAAFDAAVSGQVKFFANSMPLKDCPQRIKVTILDVNTQNNNNFACSKQDCGVDNVRNFVTGLGINIADYDAAVGVAQGTPCPPIVGCSNLADTVWITSPYESVTAHELGHIYGLADEYCSNPAGSTDCRCNDGDIPSASCGTAGYDGPATGDRNWLDTYAGCDPFAGSCCSGCVEANYNVCCEGNGNTRGGRCIMSYVGAPGPVDFCQYCKNWLATIPQLHCNSPPWPLNRSVVDMTVRVSPSDGVTEEKILLTDGRPTADQKTTGAYSVRVLDAGSAVAWERKFDLYFDYYGPRVKGVDYSNVSYDFRSVSYRIPYNATMKRLEMYHSTKLIFSKDLNFCNNNGVCDTTETYQTCRKDCPLDKKDGMCMALKDGTCDPDCLAGVDPDCITLPFSLPVLAGGAAVLLVIAAAGVVLFLRRKKQQKGT